MDSQDYLDQITAASRPVKPPKKGLQGILSSKYLKWGGIVVALFLVILLFGSMLSGKPSIEEECIELKLHLDGTTELITDFQPDVKSLSLRSLSSSLKGLFSNVSSQINSYLIKAYDFDDKHIKETTMQEAEDNKNRLGNELFDAKINGLLDRVYAHKMALEISAVVSDEKYIADVVEDGELKAFLATSQDSLNNLYTQFNDFSETNNK